MSRKTRRQSNSPPDLQRLVAVEVERRLSALSLPPGATPRPINQDALMQTMTAQQAPAAQGTPMFAPGAPIAPQPGLTPFGPRAFSFPVGYNIGSRPRSTEATGFDTLRNLAALYDGIQLCEQVWLDTVAKLNLVIKPRDEIIAEQGKSAALSKYSKKIRQYTDFFAMPDVGNGYDLKSWLRAAVRDQLQIDAVAIYVHRNRVGGVYSLELVDGALIKPLIDPRGRRPQPPFPAYEQFVYGVPAGLYTSDEMLYQRETTRTESIFGLSRVERIIVRINQALRKENKDLARFTDGNTPPGILTPPDDGSQWTPEQLLSYQDMWDALLAGNDQARSRIKVIQPGSTITSLQDPDVYLDFDRFLLNITAACYSMTMADLGFTENVNKSSGESQQNVFYRRAVEPLMDRYATLFTFILRKYFGEQDLVVAWSGFEESEDFNASAASYVSLVNAGIVSPTVAAHQMNLPWSGPDIPNFVLTKDGPIFLEDAADPGTRKALNDAKVAGAQLAAQPPPPPEPPDSANNSQKDDAQATQSGAKQRTPSPRQSGAKANPKNDDKPVKAADRADAPGFQRAAPPAWRPPSQAQLDLETRLAKAVKAFIAQARITKDGVELPGDAVQSQLLEEITACLEEAVRQGHTIATGMEERGLISAAKNLAGRAVQLVGEITDQIQNKVDEIIDSVFGSEGAGFDEGQAQASIKEQVDEWAAEYSEMVAATEIQSGVESSVLDALQERGVSLIVWCAEPDACQICKDNAEAGPWPVGTAFPSGNDCPPAHPRCRCSVAPA